MAITSPLGHVLRDDLGLRLEFERTYDTSVEDLWSALTDSDRLARWFGSWTGDPASGSVDVLMTAEEGAAAEPMEIVECTAPHHLIVRASSPDGPWLLSVDLHPQSGDGPTTLVFTHRLAEPYDASSVGPGWQYYLDRLDAVVAGEPVPTDFDPYMAELSGAYPLPD